MKIEKLENGELKLQITPDDLNEDFTVNENIYHDDMFFKDLYIQTDNNGEQYLIDYNKQLVYRLGSYLMQNPLKFLLDELQENKEVIFYPLDKTEGMDIINEIMDEGEV